MKPNTRLRHRLLTGILAIMLTLGLPTPAHAAADPVTIPDINFASCITTKLGLPEGSAVTEAQLGSLTSLECHGVTRYLTGAEKLTNLTDLKLDGPWKICSLVPLAGLTNLTSLELTASPWSTDPCSPPLGPPGRADEPDHAEAQLLLGE